MPTVEAQQIEVVLPVCDVCGRVGKVPQERGRRIYAAACTGPRDAPHKRKAMRGRRFVLAEE